MMSTLKKVITTIGIFIAISFCCYSCNFSQNSEANVTETVENTSVHTTQPQTVEKQTTKPKNYGSKNNDIQAMPMGVDETIETTTIVVDSNEEQVSQTTTTITDIITTDINIVENSSIANQEEWRNDDNIVWIDGYQYYKVIAGESWSSIAESLQVSPIQLAAANNCTVNDVLLVDTNLFIPNEYVDYTQLNNINTSETQWNTGTSSGTCLSSVTVYSAPDSASWNNIEVSTAWLNGLTLAPGEYFNWDEYIGWSTLSSDYGYQEAPIIVGNQKGYAMGGGICVTSTTLFQSARDAGMDIIERHDHSLNVSYATPGNEASVSYGSMNLIFANYTGKTVVFYTSCYYGSVTISCYIV